MRAPLTIALTLLFLFVSTGMLWGDGGGDTLYVINEDDENHPLIEPFGNYSIGTGLADAPWTMFGHDAQNTGRSQYVGPHNSDVAWVSQFEYNIRSLIIDKNDRLYASAYTPSGTGDFQVRLYAIDADGTLKWSFDGITDIWSIPSDLSAAVGLDGNVYIPDSSGKVYAIDSQGSVKWIYQQDIEGLPSSVTVAADGTLYLLMREEDPWRTVSRLYALNPDGSFKWKSDALGTYPSRAPAVGHDGTIYVTSADPYGGRGRLWAIAQNGTLKWVYEHFQTIRTPPAVGIDGTVYFGTDDSVSYPTPGAVVAINSDGTLKWYRGLGRYVSQPLGIGPDGTIYARGGPFDRLSALDPNDGVIKWTDSDSYETGIIIGVDGIIYVSYQNVRGIRAINPDGSTKWSSMPEWSDVGFPLAIGSHGTLYATIADKLYAFGYASVPPVEDNAAHIDEVHVEPPDPTVGQEITLQLTFSNTGASTHTFITGTSLWKPGSNFTSSDVDFEKEVTLAPGEQKTVSWIHPVDVAGDWGYQFGIWKTRPMVDENLLAKHPSPIEFFTVEEALLTPPLDTTSPAEVTDLTIHISSINSVTLTWTAPGDDGTVGTATSYDIRYSASLITETNWESAIQVSGVSAPKPAGSTETFVVMGLSSGTTYYFALKTADEVLNWSGLSNVVNGITEALVAKPVVTSALEITVKDTYYVGDTITAKFTVTNRGTSSVTLDVLVVGGRGPAGEIADFKKNYNVTINPDDSYHYQESLALPNDPGIYHFFCAYYTEKHIPGEDEYNWNTNIDVEIDGEIVENHMEATRYRERNIIVFDNSFVGPTASPILWEEICGPWEDRNCDISQIAVHPNNPQVIYVVAKHSHDYWGYGSEGDEIYKSANCGDSWDSINKGLPQLNWPAKYYWPIGAVAIAQSNPDIIYIGTSTFNPYSDLPSNAKGVYKSTNGGSEWTPIGGPFFTTLWIFKGYYPISSMAVHPVDPNIVYIGTVGGGIWRTTNGGEHWEKVWEEPIHKETLLEITSFAISSANPTTIYAAAYNFDSLNAMGLSGILISNRLIKSKDSGDSDTWERLRLGILTAAPKIDNITVDNKNADIVYIITEHYKVYNSMDGGENWYDVSGTGGGNPLPYFYRPWTLGKSSSISIHPDYSKVIYASGEWGFRHVYFSPDSGKNWFPFGDLKNKHVKELNIASTMDSHVIYASATEGLFKANIPHEAIIARQHSPGELRVYDSKGNITGLVNRIVKEEIPNSVYDEENKIIVIFEPSNMYRYEVAGTEEGKYGLDIASMNKGEVAAFTAIDIPLSINAIHEYTIDWQALSQGEKGVTVQVDHDGDGTPEQTLTSGDTFTVGGELSVEDMKTVSDIPEVFNLSQNYPNPFNPVTEISFTIPNTSYLTLTVFNALGQEVVTLVDEKREAGNYRVTWDGSGFPSGVYFYRLETEGFAKTMKMLLMK
jgi:outer membrane protein assembly factor BamB